MNDNPVIESYRSMLQPLQRLIEIGEGEKILYAVRAENAIFYGYRNIRYWVERDEDIPSTNRKFSERMTVRDILAEMELWVNNADKELGLCGKPA